MEAHDVVTRQAARRRGPRLLGAWMLAAALLCAGRPARAQDLEGSTDPDAAPGEGEAAQPESEPQAASEQGATDDAHAAEETGAERESSPPDDAATASASAQVDASGARSSASHASDQPAGPPDPEQRNGFVKPRSESVLTWSGSMELDAGYAKYTFESSALHDEEVYDFRGRFVLGPTVEHPFSGDWFVRARGEAVLWVREQFGVYQVNVDDAFAQVGKRDVWDFELGRFRTWRVYHKGLGFDLFTLEDAGACVQNPCSADAGTFGPHTYEVSFVYDRETPGHAAVHVYPTPWSGLELAAAYGQGGVSNTWGVRGAAMVHFDVVRVMGAAELRQARPREEAIAMDGMGNSVECDKCGVSQRKGFGGGVELTLAPFEAGFNAALGATDIYTVTTGAFDEGASNDTRSFGGYAELDVGSLAFDQGLIVGFGLNRTEALAVNENYREHMQYAAYVAYPLGFEGALVKLVLSRSDLSNMTLVDEMNRVFNESKSAMSSVRLRFAYPF